MDELLMAIHARLMGDTPLQNLYMAAGGASTIPLVIAPHQRAMASYPRCVLDGDEGTTSESFGDDVPPLLLRGKVRIELVTRQSDAYPEPMKDLRLLQRRIMTLLLGDPNQNVLPIKGQIVSDPTAAEGDLDARQWNVTEFRQITPTGMLPVTDPSFVRHLTTFEAELYRVNP